MEESNQELKNIMNFKSDFHGALRAGKDYEALMELVRQYRLQGLSLDAAYKALEELWLEHGFNETEAGEGSLQDTLETVMEKVWYGQPVL
jgi:hypothetical protein